MKKILVLFISLTALHAFFGATYPLVAGRQSAHTFLNPPPDSLVTIKGNIISAKDSIPIAARIKYKKLPYGDDVGIFTSQSNGQYEMPVVNLNSYLFEAEAEGFYPLKQQVDIRDFNNDLLIEKNFLLIPLRVGQIMEFDNILFEQSEAILLPVSFPVVDKLVDILTSQPTLVIQLEGHTDFRGPDKANRKLSHKRVKVIRDYLINKGIEKKRVKTKALGGSQPLSTEDTPEAQRLNRRVEIRILAE